MAKSVPIHTYVMQGEDAGSNPAGLRKLVHSFLRSAGFLIS